MCKLCAFTARYSHVRQDSLVFNLSQFATAVKVKPPLEPLIEPSQDRSPITTQENSA